MAKRATGVGKNKTSRSKKTAKRLAIKFERLAAIAARKGGKGTKPKPTVKKKPAVTKAVKETKK